MKFIRKHWLALLLGTAAVTGIVFFPPAIVPALIIGVASIPGFSVFGAAAGAVAHGLIAATGFVASFGIGEAITAAFNAAFGGGSGPRPPVQPSAPEQKGDVIGIGSYSLEGIKELFSNTSTQKNSLDNRSQTDAAAHYKSPVSREQEGTNNSQDRLEYDNNGELTAGV